MGKEYVWYVKKDDDYCGRLVLHIISQDKKMILAYPLHSSAPYIVSSGQIFQNFSNDERWHHYILPLEKPYPITPKFVSDIIFWAINSKNAVRATCHYSDDIWL